MNKPGPSLRLLVSSALGYMLLHALLIYATLPRTLAASYPFMVLVPLPAAVACLRQSRRGTAALRLSWLLIACSLAIWCQAMALSALEYFSARAVETIAGLSDLLFLLFTAPLLLALSSSVRGAQLRLFVWMDAAQVACAGCLVYAMVFRRLPFLHEAPHPVSMPVMLALYNTVNFALALGASLRVRLHPPGTAEGQMFRALAAFLWVYAVCAAVNNYLVSLLGDATTFIDLLADPSFLLLAVLTLRLPAAQPRSLKKLSGDLPMTRYIDNASPVVYTVTLVLLSALSLRSQFWLGLFGIALALTAYAIRTTILQNRFIRSERLLQEANDRLEELSLQDALTGVANRRSFDQRAAEEWTRAAQTPLSLLMIDLDHFKGLNDRYGHRAGDECLAAVASALQAVLPEEQGLLARYGGEEFAAVLTATDAAVAVKVAERMRQAVRALEIENAAASLNVVSVSIGAATATRGYGGSFEKLAETADRALYRAKKAGRDRVEFLMADEAETS